jgi:transposase
MARPGIGKRTAMTLVAEIGDISRFPTARKLSAWAGLTPQTAKRHPWSPALRPVGSPPRHHLATTAIARRLLARCFHLLTQLEQASIGEGQYRVRSRFRMSLQHGR